ncbi:unnamed protein product [Danaus chrysippus]|uniref:(African queen) hypothetical protein n=1 Tax=Danaus chrysippus TaxID=151541 RepID=A0A8J2MH00_9NEOP|nr:unnamed protein product [Danaus chrysippus]
MGGVIKAGARRRRWWGVLGGNSRLHPMLAKPPLHSRASYRRASTPALEVHEAIVISKIRDNISSWVLWWRQRHLRMGAPQTPKQIEEDDCVPRVAVVEEIRQQPDRKLERRRAQSGPRRRGLENELEGERRRPRRRPRQRRTDAPTSGYRFGVLNRDPQYGVKFSTSLVQMFA